MSELLQDPWWWWAAASLALGYGVLGLVGFGSALIIVPLLSWHWTLAFIVPLVLLIDIPASLLHAGLNLRHVAWRELPPLLPFAVLGVWLGTWATQALSGQAGLLAVLGAYLVWVAWRGLRQPPAATAPSRGVAVAVAGGLIGLVESMFGTAGPVVVAWLSRRLAPQALRATLPATIVVFASMALSGYAASGALAKPELWRLYPVGLAIAVAAVWVGHRIATRLDEQRLRPLIYGLLALSGMVLMGRALSAMVGTST